MMWLYSQSLKMHIYTKLSISCLYLLTLKKRFHVIVFSIFDMKLSFFFAN